MSNQHCLQVMQVLTHSRKSISPYDATKGFAQRQSPSTSYPSYQATPIFDRVSRILFQYQSGLMRLQLSIVILVFSCNKACQGIPSLDNKSKAWR